MPSGSEVRSAHVDTFARDHLPPREQWPEMRYDTLPDLAYPPRLNAARALLADMATGWARDRVAIKWPEGQWTFRELHEQANRIARVLTEDLGVVPGNRVLLRGANTPMMAACWYAVLEAGGVVVATMPLLRAREIAYICDKAQIRLALCDVRVLPDCEQAREQGKVLERIVTMGAHGERSSETGTLDAMMQAKPATFDVVDTAGDDTAMIAFTSGTTGQAKGTMHFHRDILAICDTFGKHVLKASADDTFCGSPPLAFTFGLGGLLLFPHRIGASTLLLEQATPPFLAEAIAKHKPTVVFTAPTAYRAMVPLSKQHDLSSLRLCVSAGETLPLATFESWKQATGLQIIDGIGSTEMLHIFISASGRDIRPGSTGRVVPGYEARVIGEDGVEVRTGEIGLLAVRGPTGCRYLDNPERQKGYVRDGWNYTGDSYIMDVNGYFWYQARSDDMIVSSGYNISGPEVENVLLEHPAVQECGVIGAPDEERGHIVKAFIVLRAGHSASDALRKELQDFVKHEIAPYKYPRAIEFCDKLPRTDTGKLQRFRLREQASAAPGVEAR